MSALSLYTPVTGSLQRSKDPCEPYDERYGWWEPGYNIGPGIGGGFAHWWTL